MQNYLFYIGFISEMLPLIFCVLFYKKLNTKALKVFFMYAIVLSFFAIASLIALRILKSKEAYFALLRLYNILEYSTIAFFLYHILKREILRKIILFSIVPFLIYALGDYIFSDKGQFNSQSHIISALLLILFIAYYFFEKRNTVVESGLFRSSYFWICAGFFLYFSGTFFFFLFIKSYTDKEFIKQMNLIYGVVIVAKNILFSISMFGKENIEESNESLQTPAGLNPGEFSLTA